MYSNNYTDNLMLTLLEYTNFCRFGQNFIEQDYSFTVTLNELLHETRKGQHMNLNVKFLDVHYLDLSDCIQKL